MGIDQNGNADGSRQQLVQEPKLLRADRRRHEADTGYVATRTIEAGDETHLDGVAPADENDWDCRGRCLSRSCRRSVGRSDHCHLTAYQIGCKIGKLVVLVLRPAILNRHILALDVATF